MHLPDTVSVGPHLAQKPPSPAPSLEKSVSKASVPNPTDASFQQFQSSVPLLLDHSTHLLDWTTHIATKQVLGRFAFETMVYQP